MAAQFLAAAVQRGNCKKNERLTLIQGGMSHKELEVSGHSGLGPTINVSHFEILMVINTVRMRAVGLRIRITPA